MLARRGLSARQIAERLQITVATVKSHVHTMLKRARVRGLKELLGALTNRPVFS